jgi:hypothetical protein
VRTLVAVVALAALSGSARAYDFELTAETIGQGYQLRAGDDTLVNRRRLTQYLGLEVFNIGPKDVYGRPLERNQIYLSISLRFDADLGDFANVRELTGRTPEAELNQTRLELLYAYVGGHALWDVVDFKLGRQLMVDLFDFQSFDGLSVEARTPFNVAFEAWGGLNVTGAAPFDSPVFRTDGVALGGNQRDTLGARQEDALQPTFGVAAKTVGLPYLTARLSYLRTMSFTGDQQPGEPSTGVVDEKIGLTARGRLFHGIFVPWFGFRYNLLYGGLDELQVGARINADKHHGIQAEYVYAAPTFDGDSIWNVFGAQAFNDARLTYDLTLGRWRVFARGFARLFGNEKTSANGVDPARITSLGTGTAYGASAGARLDLGRGYARLDGYYEDGYGGTKAGADLAGRLRILGDWTTGLIVEGRLSYVYFRDDSRTIDHAHSLGIQAGARYSFVKGLTLHLVVEENVNRFWSSQFRALALLDVAFTLGARGSGFARPRAWGGY